MSFVLQGLLEYTVKGIPQKVLGSAAYQVANMDVLNVSVFVIGGNGGVECFYSELLILIISLVEMLKYEFYSGNCVKYDLFLCPRVLQLSF